MYTAYHFTVTLCKVVVYRYNVYALAAECNKIRGKCGNEGLTFTCSHLCNTSLEKNNTAEYLYGIRLYAENSPHSLTAYGECVGENIIECFTVFKSFLQCRCLRLKLAVGHRRIFRFKLKNLILYRNYSLDFFFGIVTEYFCK